MPVFNEKNTIEEIISRIQSVDVGIKKEIILVDDCSNDGTREILKKIDQNNIKIYFHKKNQGKGAALQTGFSKVEGDIILIQDADLEYDPRE